MIRWTEKEEKINYPDKCRNCDMPLSYKKNAFGRCGYCYGEKRKLEKKLKEEEFEKELRRDAEREELKEMLNEREE